MHETTQSNDVESYLRTLDRLLRNAPSVLRKELVEDIAEHIDEGRQQGRSEAEMIKALGAPAAIAGPLLEELAIRGDAPRIKRNRSVLGVVALIAGVFATIMARSSDFAVSNMAFGPDLIQGASINYEYSEFFAATQLGVFLVLGLMVPASVLMPAKLARRYSLVAAMLISAAVVVFSTGIGLYFVPSMVAAWMLFRTSNMQITPQQITRRMRKIRILGFIALLLPVVAVISGLISGATGGGVAPFVYAIAGIACSVAYLRGIKAGAWVTAVLGALLIAGSIVDQGLLMPAFWLAGTAYFYLGLYALLWGSAGHAEQQ